MTIDCLKALLAGLEGETKSMTFKFDFDMEARADEVVYRFKENQGTYGYTVAKTNIDYKSKKDKESGEIIDEHWITTITIAGDD